MTAIFETRSRHETMAFLDPLRTLSWTCEWFAQVEPIFESGPYANLATALVHDVPMDGTWDSRVEAAAAARLATFRQIGIPSEDVLAPVLGPALTGGPVWPTRPAWRVIRRNGSIIVASDGLSDAWQSKPGPGFGVEVFMEARDDLVAPDAGIREVGLTWLFSAVQEISNVIAGHGGVRQLLDDLGTVSVEIAGEAFPEGLRNEHGRVGVLLGVPTRGIPNRIEYDDGDAYLVAITVLTLPELKHIVEIGDKARRAIAERLGASEYGHLSNLERPSIMDAEHAGEPAARAKSAAKKPAAKGKKPAAKKPAAKAKPAAKTKAKPAAKKPAAKKPAAKKPAAKKPAAKSKPKKR